MQIAIVGAGAWGTALAVRAAQPQCGHVVSLWARDAAQVDAMRRQRVNPRYLPQISLPAALELGHWPVPAGLARDVELQACKTADLVVVATPMAALRDMLVALRDCAAPVAWLCKGFEQSAPSPGCARPPEGVQENLGAARRFLESAPSPGCARPPEGVQENLGAARRFLMSPTGAAPQAVGRMAHEIQLQVAPGLRAGVLSGPSFALEVAQGKPAALVAASADAQVRAALVAAFHGPTLRIYSSDDVVGVEVGGAVKNVLAIAAGLCDGLQLGHNARAALITRGLHEMTRLGVALGARAETFMGLSGLGDLVLTATGDLSRNRRIGLALAQGQTLAAAVQSLGHVAEGVYCARTVVQRAAALGIEMPIAAAVDALLDGRLTPAQAVTALMEREARAEAQV